MYQHGGDIYSHPKTVDFSANINCLGMPEAVRQAAIKGIMEGENYPKPFSEDLCTAIARAEGIDRKGIFCGNGASEIMELLVRAVRPKKALVTAPTFYEYERILKAEHCQIERFYLQEEKKFSLDLEILNKINGDIELVFICNPNNPTGKLIEKPLLKQILERCKECEAILAVDESFLNFTEDYLSLGMKEYYSNKNLFIIKSFTKMYAIPGLRLGYGIGGDFGLVERLRQLVQPWNVSLPAQLAGEAALREVGFEERTRKLIKRERQVLWKGLEDCGYRVFGGEANFIFFKGARGLFDKCLEQGFLIRDCSNYEGLEEGYYRIAVKKKEENTAFLHMLAQDMQEV